MIFLDAKRYRIGGFEDIYFKIVYAAICRMQGEKKDRGWKKNSSDTYCIPRELVRSLKAAKIVGMFAGGTASVGDIDRLDESELKEILRNLILADANKLRRACEVLNSDESAGDFLKYFSVNAYASMCRTVVPDLWDDRAEVSLPVRMVEQLGLRTCPYCNRDYIGISKGKNLGVQLDHFFSKSKYPYFAVSLYNLIPSCGVCNNVKRAEDGKALISPFEEEISEEGASFRLEWDGETENIFVKPKDEKHKNNMKAFHLETAYAFHQVEARHFREKLTAYPPSMLDEIARMLAGRASGVVKDQVRQELEMSLFGEYFTDPDEYDQKPLSKLHRDLYYEFRGWKR